MTMARYTGVVQDQAGNIITNAKIEVRRETPGQPLAAIKSDREGLSSLTNPFNANADGTFAFHAVGGAYKIRAYVGSSSAPTFEDIRRYEPVGLLQEYDIDAVLIGKRQQVRVATTANITISTALNNGDTLDGVTLATNDLVLVKDQTSKQQNGIYVVGVTPARYAAFDTYDEHAGAMIAVVSGTSNASTAWFCTANAGGILDTTAIDFTKVAAIAGPPGADGEPGPPGPATIAIGTVTTVAAGEDATVTNSGTADDVILDFEIPEGAVGPTGPANSLSIGTVTGGVSADATITGTAPTQTLNLVLPQGAPGGDGSDGADGAAATITIGTVTTVAPGDPATVTNVGTSGAAILDFEIPQGDPGDVVGPGSATADRFAAFDGTTGKLIKDSGSTASTFATAAQGSKADSALQPAAIGVSVQAYDADLAAIAGLADPNADRILFWDDSAGAYTFLTLSAGLEISGTTIRAIETHGIALSDETTAITTGANKATMSLPYAFTVTGVYATLNTASSSGTPTVDINEAGTTILSTKLTIDASEKTSATAATPAVISDASIAANAEIGFDIDTAGTGAKGLKVWLQGYRT